MRTLAPTLGLEKEFLLLMTLWERCSAQERLSLVLKLLRLVATVMLLIPSVVFCLLVCSKDYLLQLRFSVNRRDNGNSVLCFYEAYFSNYIEGTKFTIEEAKDIVFNNRIPQHRPDDAHDISGTYNVLADMTEMRKHRSHLTTFLPY